jgi:RNA polymerase sigma factor (sigma-70 family)
MEEKDLVILCIKGNRSAQSELVVSFAPRLLSLIKRYQPRSLSPEDILQEVFIEIFRDLKTYEHEKGALYSWMKTIAIRLTLKKRRLDQSWLKDKTVPLEYSDAVPELDQILNKINTEDIMKMIISLPDGYREVFNLVAVEGYSHDECASLLQIAVGTSRSTLSRARQILKEQYAQMKIY